MHTYRGFIYIICLSVFSVLVPAVYRYRPSVRDALLLQVDLL